MATLTADLEFRGLIHQVTDPTVLDKLNDERLTAYIGFDPTADSLHVGSLLQLCNLRRLQLAGHRPIALAGGGTGMIGDPGGKSEERNLLSVEELAANVAGIRPQLERFLDFSDGPSPSRAILLDNSTWLGSVGLVGFLRDVGKHFTVNQMVGKESVRTRLDRPEQGISFTEFSYMLLQAYDFQQLFDAHDCRLQLGGSDQWGNITMGIELIRKTRQAEVFGLTTPLILQADGTKFGKTEKGSVWLDARRTSPYQLYQYFLRTEDATVGTVLRMLTFLDHDTIRSLEAQTTEHPERREAQRALAHEVCALVHGESEAVRAAAAASALYSEEIATLDEATMLDVCADAPTTTISRAELDAGLTLVDALVLSGLAPSKGRARTTVTQGGAYVNNQRVDDSDARLGPDHLLFGRYLILRRGQRDYHLLRFE
jgi:tyrosyl-tRNA synthetase